MSRKPKAEPVIYEGYSCDSKAECYTLMWIFELRNAGFIVPMSIEREQPTFPLVGPVIKSYTRGVNRNILDSETILEEHVYTPDFRFTLTEAGKQFKLFKAIDTPDKLVQRSAHYIIHQDGVVHIETKGTDFRHNNNSVEKFMISRKWVYNKHGVFINLFFPSKVFEKTFTPAEYWWTDAKRQARKIPWKIRTLTEYVEMNP